MISLLLVLAAQSGAAVRPPAGIYEELWDDIRTNVLIGNGNPAVSMEWTTGYELQIREFSCHRRPGGLRCSFGLSRSRIPDQDPMADGAALSDHLSCVVDLAPARVVRGSITWLVVHTPPGPDGGHSRTSMQCAETRPA